MIGRRAVIGLSLLSALLFCAFAAQSASAALTTSKNTTAFTCVKGGTNDFGDEHCDTTKAGGGFGHELIVGKTDKVDATNNAVTNATKDSEPAVLKGEVALTKTEITCTVVKNNTANSSLENSEPSEKAHTLSGKARVEYSTCTVNKPLKCTVKTPIVANATVHGVEGMEGPKGEKNAMGLEFIGSGAEETFAEITYEGAECGLKGKTFKVKGKAIGTSGPTTESAQENKESGATLVFTPLFKMEELKFGVAAAEFTSCVTVKMEGGNPITATTTT